MNRPFLHQEVPVLTRMAAVVGITVPAYFAGQVGAISYLMCPSILMSPAPLLARQWKHVYDKGRSLALSSVGVGFTALAYLAWRQPTDSRPFKLYAAAAVLLPSLIPYTALVIGPINSKLLNKVDSLAASSLEDTAAEAGVAKEETTHALVDAWAVRNLGRAVLGFTVSVLALWASLNPIEVVAIEKISLTTGANRM